MTARPRGAFCSPPSPRPSDIGSMPTIIARAVISTGRSRVDPAARAAPRASEPLPALFVGEGDHQDAVGRGHPDAHDRAHQGGHAEGRLGQEQDPEDAGQRPGQRGQDDERVQPRLEVHHHEEVDEQDREDQAGRQPEERAVHALHLAADHDRAAARQFLPGRVHDLLDVGRDGPEVTALDVGVDVVGRLDVVVVDVRRLRAPAQDRQVAEELSRLRRASPWPSRPGRGGRARLAP